jgi:hypothetical protein
VTLPNIKNQHYVWRYYLAPWASGGAFFCYRRADKRLFATQPKSIGSETFFYETKEITPADKKYLDSLISKATDAELRELNQNFVDLLQMTFRLRAQLKAKLAPQVRDDIESELRRIEKTLGERYHTGIEHKCIDILDWLRRENDEFYGDPARCADFLYYLPLQYFRTAKMREAIGGVPSGIPGHDPRRTSNIVSHIYATNVGAGLYREKKLYKIVFLRNETDIPLVTADQPVINILDPLKTDDLEFYYPLSPKLAVVLTKDARKFPDKKRDMSKFEVETYNYAIFSNSRDQVYANDRFYLVALVSLGKQLLAS